MIIVISSSTSGHMDTGRIWERKAVQLLAQLKIKYVKGKVYHRDKDIPEIESQAFRCVDNLFQRSEERRVGKECSS